MINNTIFRRPIRISYELFISHIIDHCIPILSTNELSSCKGYSPVHLMHLANYQRIQYVYFTKCCMVYKYYSLPLYYCFQILGANIIFKFSIT